MNRARASYGRWLLMWGLCLMMPQLGWGQTSPSERLTKKGPADSLRQRPFKPMKARPVASDAPQDTTAKDSAPKRVKILNAELLTFQQREDTAVQKLIGDVRLEQDSTFFYCDSAYLYERDNRLKAFSNVRIEMPDSVLLLGDRLTYDGNSRIAKVYDNITLTDQQSELTTDRLTYHREEEYGYYQQGGQLVDDSTTLTSERGYYYPNQDEAFFRGDVVLAHPDYTLMTDTLGYDTKTKTARFITLTTIINEDGTIETTKGSYDTEGGKIDLFERSHIQDSAYTLTADTLLYTDDDRLGLALGDVVVSQEDSSVELRGTYARFNRDTDESFITGDAVAIQRMEDDTLYMFADTLFSLKDTFYHDRLEDERLAWTSTKAHVMDSLSQDSVEVLPADLPRVQVDSATAADSLRYRAVQMQALADSLAVQHLGRQYWLVGPPTQARFEKRIDTTVKRKFLGYHNVEFFMNDMQGLADSMIYFYDDSLLYLYTDPVLWAEDNQLTGDTIAVWLKNEKADSMKITGHSFMAAKVDTIGFNQLKGRDMHIKFRNNELYRVRITGNSESIYFIPEEGDSTETDQPTSYQGMNKAIANDMILYFLDREVNKIVFLRNPEGTFFPFFEVVFEDNTLEGLNWRGDERPLKPIWLIDSLPAVPLDSGKRPLPMDSSKTLPPLEGKPLSKPQLPFGPKPDADLIPAAATKPLEEKE